MSTLYYILIFIVINEVKSEINNGNCWKCPPGWGVTNPCTAHTPTECERCVVGHTYSSQNSMTGLCLPCSRCGIGLYEARRCSARRDTVCDDCTRFIYKPEIVNNKDFHKKCSYLFLRKTRFKSGKIIHGESHA